MPTNAELAVLYAKRDQGEASSSRLLIPTLVYVTLSMLSTLSYRNRLWQEKAELA